MQTSTCKVARTNDAAIALLGQAIGFTANGNGIYHHGQKHPCAPAFFDTGAVYVSSAALSDALDGRDVPTDLVRDGIGYCDAIRFCAAAGLHAEQDERGLVIIGDVTMPTAKGEIAEINNFLLYDRPDAQTLKRLFDSVNRNTHPRIFMDPTKKQEMLERFRTNETVKAWGEQIIARAEEMLDAPDPEYVIPDGKRLLAMSRRVYGYARTLGGAYLLTGDVRFAKNLYKKLVAAANFPDWNPSHFLDTGEMTTALAIGYDWCYDVYTEEERETLAQAIFRHGVNVGRACYYNETPAWWTPGNTSNWNVVCNGGMAIGAIAIFDRNPDVCADVISIALRDLEPMMNSFYPDGAWFEGVGYWEYTISYLLNMITSLNGCFATDFNVSNAPALDKTGYYVIGGDGPIGINNFHDAGLGHTNHPALFWISDRYNIPGLTNVRLFKQQLYGTKPEIFDLLWYNTDISGVDFRLPLDFYMRDVEFVSMRGSWIDPNTAFLSYHAGANNVNHGHLDAGSFVFDLMNERWAIDLSSDDYNLPFYFGRERYNYYRVRTEGHNAFVIRPRAEDAQEPRSFSPVLSLESGARGARSVVDLTPAYHKDAARARRAFLLGDDRRSVTIRDEIEFLSTEEEFYWFIHTRADVEVCDASTAIFRAKGKTLLVRIASDLADYTLSVMDARPLPTSPDHPNQNKNEGVRKLALHAKKTGRSCFVQVKLISADDPNADLPMEIVAIDDQRIPD